MSSIRDIRTDYTKGTLSPGDLNDCPGDQLRLWIEEADRCGIGDANAKRWLREGKCAFLPEEIEMWNSIKNLGFVDSWRMQNPDESSIYSWFDYRSRMFDDDPKRGLRIDHIMVSDNLKRMIKSTGIDYDARAMEKPSDHCPV